MLTQLLCTVILQEFLNPLSVVSNHILFGNQHLKTIELESRGFFMRSLIRYGTVMRYFHEMFIEDFYDVFLHNIIYLMTRQRSECLLYLQHCHELLRYCTPSYSLQLDEGSYPPPQCASIGALLL